MRKVTYVCDAPGCQAERREGDKWWVVNRVQGAAIVAPWGRRSEWEDKDTGPKAASDLSFNRYACSESHAVQLVRQVMGELVRDEVAGRLKGGAEEEKESTGQAVIGKAGQIAKLAKLKAEIENMANKFIPGQVSTSPVLLPHPPKSPLP